MCGSHGMRDLGRRELDHLWAGVRLGGVAGRTPPRGCGGAAECVGGGGIRGVRRGRGRPGDPGIREAFHTGAGDLGARIWGSVRDPWVARVGWVASPSLPQSMNSQQREELARREAEPGVKAEITAAMREKREKDEREQKAKQASPGEPHPIPSHPNPISPCNRGCGSVHQHGGSAPGTLVGSEGIRGICAWYLGRI